MHFTYLIILGACVIGTLPLEFVLHTRVYRRWPQLLAAVLPVVAVFGAWDALAIRAGWWTYDPAFVIGVRTLGRLPLEEVLFFAVIPTCAVLTFEAVQSYKPEWFARDRAATYTVAAVLGVLGAAALDLGLLRTRLLVRREFWVSYAILVFFQLIVNGLLTGLDIVRYNPSDILGFRIAFAPVEDLLFGFAMVLMTLALWVWAGQRSRSAEEG